MADKNFAEIAKKHGGVPAESTSAMHESPDAIIPPAVERIKHAVGVNFTEGKPFKGYGGEGVIASVGEHDPHNVEINDKARFNQGPKQIQGHEIVHVWRNNLPLATQKAIPPDNPNHPYDISNIDELRKKGATLATLPNEAAARVIQQWIADPASRQRLQPWVDDLNKIPLSVINPTDPGQRGINTTVRPPTPPIESYLPALKEEAQRRNPKR